MKLCFSFIREKRQEPLYCYEVSQLWTYQEVIE